MTSKLYLSLSCMAFMLASSSSFAGAGVVDECYDAPAVSNPDDLRGHRSDALANTSSRVSDAYTIMLFNGKSTDPMANHGTIEFMRHALLSDDKFYDSTLRFYRALYHKENRTPYEGNKNDFVPIQKPSEVDVYKLALNESGGDPYLAFKILGVYGHDNEKNSLFDCEEGSGPERASCSCKLQELDVYKPDPWSNLYRNGALAGLSYDEADIKKGEKIAADCGAYATAFTGDSAKELCNDLHSSYQADYYHVILDAMLECRNLTRKNIRTTEQKTVSKMPDLMIEAQNISDPLEDAVGEQAYLKFVENYKERAFQDKLTEADERTQSSSDKRMIELIRRYLPAAKAGKNPVIPSYTEVRASLQPSPFAKGIERDTVGEKLELKSLSTKEYLAVKAVLERYSFEFKFRRMQHQIGAKFAAPLCAKSGLPDENKTNHDHSLAKGAVNQSPSESKEKTDVISPSGADVKGP